METYGRRGAVTVHGKITGRVDGDAQICDLVAIAEGAHIGGRSILCGDDIVRGELSR
jgi:hypothetical protein